MEERVEAWSIKQAIEILRVRPKMTMQCHNCWRVPLHYMRTDNLVYNINNELVNAIWILLAFTDNERIEGGSVQL